MTLSWKRKPLDERAAISARRRNEFNQHWPRRWWLFGPRVVPLEVFILALARSHQSFDKDRARLMGRIHGLQAGLRRRNESMGKAHRYIQALKRHAGLPLTGLTVLPEPMTTEQMIQAHERFRDAVIGLQDNEVKK